MGREQAERTAELKGDQAESGGEPNAQCAGSFGTCFDGPGKRLCGRQLAAKPKAGVFERQRGVAPCRMTTQLLISPKLTSDPAWRSVKFWSDVCSHHLSAVLRN